MNQNTLEVWTIYAHPRDYPQGYVVRRAVIGGGRECPKCLADLPHDPCPLADKVAHYARDLLEARSFVPLGLGRILRSRDDDPAVVECWL